MLMRKLGAVLLLVLGAGLAFQAYDNAESPHPVDAQAEAVVCGEMQLCQVATWASVDTTPFVRRYTLDAEQGRGIVHVECRWAAILFGKVTCHATREDVLGQVPNDDGPAPHELQRGQR